MNKGKKWGIIVGLVVSLPIIIFLIVSIFTLIRQKHIVKNTVKDVLQNSFNIKNEKSKIGSILDHDNGYVVFNITADNESTAVDSLQLAYHVLSSKKESKSMDKISVAVYNQSGDGVIFTSSVWVNELKVTDWASINNYEEFKQKANIQ